MSEFSESYHLRAASREDGCALLRAAGLRGYVFPAAGGWVPLVAEGEAFERNETLVAASGGGVLLRYLSAVGHGWGFELFRGGTAVSRYLREYEHETSQVRMMDVDLPVLREILGPGFARLDDDALRRIFDVPDDDDEARPHPLDEDPAALFARAAGLSRYSWTSYAYAEERYGDAARRAAEGVVRVG